jgi:Pyridoxamine 5'-phosphate oxidase
MAQLHPNITPDLKAFIEAQPMFFVGSAPLSADGRVNVSPKGLDSFRILSENEVVYLDLTGSGNETSAHLEENGRITIMFCAFSGAPNILRLYGTGKVVLATNPEAQKYAPLFENYAGTRQFVVVNVETVQTSCGWGVPKMALQSQRDGLPKWAAQKGASEMVAYRNLKNLKSIDGLPTTLASCLHN